nr:hypothetical protein [Tanacetum cinerariifolium]
MRKEVLKKISALITNQSQRIIPGPDGIVQAAKLGKIFDTRESEDESIMSTQDYIRKVIEDMGEDDDLYVNVDGKIMSGCFEYIKKFLKNGKLEKFVTIIKCCTPNALGDLTVSLKDLSCAISSTIHYKVLKEERVSFSLFSRFISAIINGGAATTTKVVSGTVYTDNGHDREGYEDCIAGLGSTTKDEGGAAGNTADISQNRPAIC